MAINSLGILGGGQLGRMLCQAAHELKINTSVLDPTPNSPAGQIVQKQIVGDFKDAKKVKSFSKKVDALTFEIEGANANVLKELKKEGLHVQPSGKTLEVIQDKFAQKELLKKNKLPLPKFAKVESFEDAKNFGNKFDYPIVLKARHHAYDGRGNALVKSEKDLKRGFEKLSDKDLYVEQFIPFKKEIAIQVSRGSEKSLRYFPVVETIQKNNICHIVIAPASIPSKSRNNAKLLAKKVMSLLKGKGVFAIEMFLTKDNKVLINEIAPRVHNSGHYTIEACSVSQFEQHVRCVCKLPTKSIRMLHPAAVLINILGTRNGRVRLKGIKKAQEIPGVFVHIYGKNETRVERKMGHITALDKSTKEALQKAQKARRLISI